jgi:hypothetical protein
MLSSSFGVATTLYLVFEAVASENTKKKKEKGENLKRRDGLRL